uniref:Phage holin family protein n=1 Tax=Roseihalotalea indica TaxID=2867963 RepID=A0AA49GK82_9BACT|nr:phage holin family protein [Tunicatimonas sp. TK19036]
MNYTTSPLEKLIQDVKDYIIIQRQLISTVASKKGADIFYVIVAACVFGLIGLFIAIFLSFTAAYGIALLLDNTFLGFLIVTLFYVLLFFIIWFNKDRFIKIPILKLFLNAFNTYKTPTDEQTT